MEVKAPSSQQDQAQVPLSCRKGLFLFGLKLAGPQKGYTLPAALYLLMMSFMDKHPPIHSLKGLHLYLQFCEWSLLVQTGP